MALLDFTQFLKIQGSHKELWGSKNISFNNFGTLVHHVLAHSMRHLIRLEQQCNLSSSIFTNVPLCFAEKHF